MKISPSNWWTTTINLDEELKILKNKVDHLKAVESDKVTAANNEVIQPGKKRKREFEFWLKNVESKKSIYSQIENELREQKPSKNLKSRIEKEIKEVEELIQQGRFPKGVVLDDHASTSLKLVTPRLVGQSCADHVETISKLLKEDGVFAIGVHGMGGVGKTTMMKKIYNRLRLDSDIAGKVHWVTASQDCSLEKLQNKIGKAVGLLDFSKEDDEIKKALLFQRFSDLKNSVLIIDDLWDSYPMENIGIPLESSGCKVVITTRELQVCRRMTCQRTISIMPLNEPDSWTLFIEKLGELPIDVEDIAKDIVKECGGLPLALITMGACMRAFTNVCEWKNALVELRKPAINQDDMKAALFRKLKFSFDGLKDHRVQNCFLSCVLFPEDEEIEEVDLVGLWNNEGLLDDMENQKDRVNKGHVILNRLVNACLLERGGDSLGRSVKMHDVIRDMGIIITRDHPLFIAQAGKKLKQVPKEEKWSKDLVKVSFGDNEIEEIPSGMAPRTPNLTVLMLNGNWRLQEIPYSFFQHMRALTHLDLSKTHIKWVPESVSDLENLRGLLLVDCMYLIYVPSVAKLTELRTLNLKGCNELRETPKGLERLKSVEKLSYIPWDVSDLVGFNKVVQCLTSLSSFKFCIGDRTKFESSLHHSSSFCEYDKVMWIRVKYLGRDTSSILVPATLEYLLIEASEIKGTIFGDVFQSLGEAKGLKQISICDCRGLEYISGSSGTQPGSSLVCTTLEELKLVWLPDLRSIAKSRTPGSFSHLRVLHMIWCTNVKVVVPVTCTNHVLFPNLEIIMVAYCEEVVEIFETNKATLPNPILSLPKLKELSLEYLPKIKVMFPFTEELHLPNLESISLKTCHAVEEIFETKEATPSSNSILSLAKLKELTLKRLNKLKVIFPFTEKLHLPNLESISLDCCGAVEEIFETNQAFTEELRLPNLSLPNLKEFTVKFLSKIKVIFPFMEELCLPNLEFFFVESCYKLEEIFETKKAISCKSNPTLSLPKLKNLQLEDIPKLGSIYRGLLISTSLINLDESVLYCPKLTLWRLPGGGLTSDELCLMMESNDISCIMQPVSDSEDESFSSMMNFQEETLPLTDSFHGINQPACLLQCEGNNDDDITQWGAFLSLQ